MPLRIRVTICSAVASQSNHCSAFFANEVLCATGPCYTFEVFRATGPCYAIDESYCATPMQLADLLCIPCLCQEPPGCELPKRYFALLRRSNASLHGSIQCLCCSKHVVSQPCRCCANLSVAVVTLCNSLPSLYQAKPLLRRIEPCPCTHVCALP